MKTDNIKDCMIHVTKVYAPEIDMSSFLKEGEIDVTNIKTDEINKILSKKETISIIKNIAYLYTISPVTVYKTGLTKRSMIGIEVQSQIFESIDNIKNFLKNEKGVIVYQIIYNTIYNKYMLRYFNKRTSFIKYWFNKKFVWKNNI